MAIPERPRSLRTALTPTRELAALRRHLDTLSKIALLLLESGDEQTWVEVLRLLVETTEASHCCLFLDTSAPDGSPAARLAATWSAAETSWLANFGGFRVLFYDRVPNLSDRLRVGMVFSATAAEFAEEERALFSPAGIGSVLCIPLLVKGEMIGFLGLFAVAPERHWEATDVEVLCTVANELSLALVRRQTESALKASEARLKALVGVTEDVVVEYDGAQTVHQIWTENPLVRALLPARPTGGLLSDVLPEEMASALVAVARDVLRGVNRHAEFTLHTAAGPRLFLGRMQRLPGEEGDTPHIVALLRDVTDLREEEARRKIMVDTLNLLDEAIIDLDPAGNLQAASAAWHRLCGPMGAAEHSLGSLLQYIQADDHQQVLATLDALVSGEKKLATLRFRMLRPGSEQLWVECRLLAVPGPEGRVVSLRGILRDVTAMYLQERRIRQLALHDALTQLPNRILFEEHLQQGIARASRNGSKLALGFIDLDHFKHINDTLGHKAGDTVLLTLSRRLAAVLRESDVLSRWGGDEFVVLLGDSSDEEDFRQVARRLCEAARQPIDIEGIQTRLTLSVGFAVYPDDAEDAETLTSLADHTMFHAKNMGRNNVQFFREIQGTVLDRENVLLQTRLAQAIQERQLQIFYQPVVDASTGRILSLEALARWHDDHDGWVPPDVFIPMAEHLGLIHELGEQVFEHALDRLRVWRQAGHEVKVAVNLSRAQLFAPNFVERLTGMIADQGLSPTDIILEITESVALLDVSYESRRLQELADSGFELAIDDFGTGYSGLAQLHQMPVRRLKVDASFTTRLHTEDGQRIVQAIVQMAQALRLETVVEGVENAEDARYLMQLGVRQMQGQLFGDPMPAGVCDMLLARQAAQRS
ncbi:sensor domain-containing phosphodiesterase [Thiobacter aerophilum]|uniref:EAL domain-containing protein n=1 Tax=Thiobacter aerophilum TaxID=3121275 RepID=A0ABV0EF34_9BURK